MPPVPEVDENLMEADVLTEGQMSAPSTLSAEAIALLTQSFWDLTQKSGMNSEEALIYMAQHAQNQEEMNCVRQVAVNLHSVGMVNSQFLTQLR